MMDSNKLRVAVIFGGQSVEHEISILSARSIVQALDRTRFEPLLLGVDARGRFFKQSESHLLSGARDPRQAALQQEHGLGVSEALMPRGDTPTPPFDVAFPIIHGTTGEDGQLQGLLEWADVPYVGAGVLGSAVGMDKDVMKRLLKEAGVPVAPFVTVRAHEWAANREAVLARVQTWPLPLFVKPANAGSSVGVGKVKERAELAAAIEEALRYDLKILIEQGILGREVECAVLGNETPRASAVGEIVVTHADGFYSYDAKYIDESGAQLKMPADLDEAMVRQIQALALQTFTALECSGLARVDLFLTPEGTLWVNEINTLPGFTAISMYPQLWALSGVGRQELVSTLIDLALQKHRQKKSLHTARHT